MEETRKNFYANSVNMAGSLYDLTIVFRSQAPQLDDTGKPLIINGQPAISIADELTVRMSPQHAKAFAALLVQQIANYEESLSVKLPIPPEIEQVWNKFMKGKQP